MKIIRTGCTRIVITTANYAFKLPNFTIDFQFFLKGLLANMQENDWSKANLEGFCPVVFSLPYGLLTVMKRAQILSIDEFLVFDYQNFVERPGYHIPVESKFDSFGWLNGQIVAVDYGS